MNKKIGSLILSIIFLLTCDRSDEIRPVERTRILMDTIVTITIYDNDRDQVEVEQIIDEAFTRMEQIDSLANNYNELSLVAYINKNAYLKEIEIDAGLSKVIGTSLEISKISDGAFDISVGPLMQLWPFQDSLYVVPTQQEIDALLPDVNYKDIVLSGDKIKFNNPNLKIDLGGIAKGFAVDQGMKVIVQHRIHDAMINAGGDLQAICSELTRGKRKVWIQHPRAGDKLYGYFQMDDGSVATSGDYERYFMVDSVRYHHILNPKTGYPADSCVSVTIQAIDPTIGDALSTAVFVLGPKKGLDLINHLDGVEGVILFFKEKNLEHIVSEGLKGKFIKLN